MARKRKPGRPKGSKTAAQRAEPIKTAASIVKRDIPLEADLIARLLSLTPSSMARIAIVLQAFAK